MDYIKELITYKPAIIALLHHLNYIALPQLQLISILRLVVVNRLITDGETEY